MKRHKFTTVDEYIDSFPAPVRKMLKEIRKTIREAAPEAKEQISYNIPAFKLNSKGLVWFAAFTHHISMYPVSSSSEFFKKNLSRYAGSKGTVRFPIDEPIPLKLVAKIVKWRIAEGKK